MLRGGGWFGIDEINFGIENELYVHLRDPSAPLDFISETRIINSETFSAPESRASDKHIIHAAGRLVTIIGTRGMVYDHITFAGVIMGAALVLGPPKNMGGLETLA